MAESKKWFVNQLLEILDKHRKTINLSPTKRLILICVAHYANKNGECWPSVQTIADFTGLGRTSIKNNLKEMEMDSILTVKERYKLSGDRDSNYLKINLQKIFNEVGHEVTYVGHEVTEGWVTSHQGVGHEVTPNKLLELHKETTQGVRDFVLEENEETKAVDSFMNQIENGIFKNIN